MTIPTDPIRSIPRPLKLLEAINRLGPARERNGVGGRNDQWQTEWNLRTKQNSSGPPSRRKEIREVQMRRKAGFDR
jgi:hypothetical protein